MLACSDLAVKEEKLGWLDPSIKGHLNIQMLGLNGSIKKLLGSSIRYANINFLSFGIFK
jgi:hypothetical protein